MIWPYFIIGLVCFISGMLVTLALVEAGDRDEEDEQRGN